MGGGGVIWEQTTFFKVWRPARLERNHTVPRTLCLCSLHCLRPYDQCICFWPKRCCSNFGISFRMTPLGLLSKTSHFHPHPPPFPPLTPSPPTASRLHAVMLCHQPLLAFSVRMKIGQFGYQEELRVGDEGLTTCAFFFIWVWTRNDGWKPSRDVTMFNDVGSFIIFLIKTYQSWIFPKCVRFLSLMILNFLNFSVIRVSWARLWHFLPLWERG